MAVRIPCTADAGNDLLIDCHNSMKMSSWLGAAVAALYWHGDINNESKGKESDPGYEGDRQA
jgi:hypothetical protein